MSLDKTFCASPKCKNECKRQMGERDKEFLKELAFRGIFRGMKIGKLISYAYFCGEPSKEEIEND